MVESREHIEDIEETWVRLPASESGESNEDDNKLYEKDALNLSAYDRMRLSSED